MTLTAPITHPITLWVTDEEEAELRAVVRGWSRGGCEIHGGSMNAGTRLPRKTVGNGRRDRDGEDKSGEGLTLVDGVVIDKSRLDDAEIGRTLRFYRERAGLTQVLAGQLLGVSQPVVRNWEILKMHPKARLSEVFRTYKMSEEEQQSVLLADWSRRGRPPAAMSKNQVAIDRTGKVMW